MQLMPRLPPGAAAPERLVVAGFSQGGAIALRSGLLRPQPLGGIIALSTWLPLAQEYKLEGVATPPVLMCHGTKDPVVQPRFGSASVDKLKALGVEVDFKTYPMVHSACDEELADVVRWLAKRLPQDCAATKL